MRIRKQFNNLKAGAKKVLIGLMILSLLSTATGIGTVFSYATEEDPITLLPSDPTSEDNLEGLEGIGSEEEHEGGDVIDGSGEGEEAGTEGGNTGADESGIIPDDENTEGGEGITPDEENTEEGEDTLPDEEDTKGGKGTTSEDGEHVHVFEYTYNGDGTHTGVCECGEIVTEPCDAGDEWISDGIGFHAKRCLLCDAVIEEEECDTLGEGGACSVCGYKEGTKKRGASKLMEPGDTEAIPYEVGKVLCDKIGFHERDDHLTYDGSSQMLYLYNTSTHGVASLSKDGKTYEVNGSGYNFAVDPENPENEIDCKNAGRKIFCLKLKVKVTPGGEESYFSYWVSDDVWEATIDPLDIASSSVKCTPIEVGLWTFLEPVDYMQGTASGGNTGMYIRHITSGEGTYELVSGTDYSVEITAPSDKIPEVFPDSFGQASFRLTGKGNYTGTRDILNRYFDRLDSLVFLYNGVTTKRDSYTEKVELSVKGGGYELSKDGSSYSEKVAITFEDVVDGRVTLYIRASGKSYPVKTSIDGLVIKKRDIKDANVSAIDYTKDDICSLTYTLGEETETLKYNTDYTYEIDESAFADGVPVADGTTEYTIKFFGMGKYYNGDDDLPLVKTFTIPARTLLFNGTPADAEGKARASVNATVTEQEGFKISKTQEGSFSNNVVFDASAPYTLEETFDAYLKRADNSQHIIKQTFTVEFSKKSIDSDDVKISEINFLADTAYSVKYEPEGGTSVTLTEGEDGDYTATVTEPSDGIPVADGSTNNSYLFKGQNRFSGEKSVGFTVPKSLYFNESTDMNAEGYVQSVTLTGPAGFKLSTSIDGDYQSSIELTYDKENDQDKEYDPFTVYLRTEAGNRVVTVKQEVTGLKVAKPPLEFEDFFPQMPKAASGLVYNGQEQYLFSDFVEATAPTDPFDPSRKVEIIYSGETRTSKKGDFVGTMAKDYPVAYDVVYTTSGTSKPIKVSRDFGKVTIAQKDIADLITLSDQVRKTENGNIDYVASNVDFSSDAFILKLNETALVKDTDYTMTFDPQLPDSDTIVNEGDKYKVTFTGKGNFKGIKEYDIEVSTGNVTFNGSATLAKSYFEYVEIGAPSGCQISRSSFGEYVDSFVYDELGENPITIFVKNKTTGRIMSATLKGIKIVPFSVLYDGDPVISNPYYDSVRISAEGFEVAASRGGSYSSYYVCTKAGKVPEFSLFFKNKVTDQVIEKKISGLVIEKDIDLPAKYNGDKYKDWFNTDVTITCEGYKLRETETGAFNESFKVVGEGIHECELDFQNKNDTSDIQTFKIIIRIDKTAPKGKITVGEHTSELFQRADRLAFSTNEAMEITLSGQETDSESASGIDYIGYFSYDTFYSAPADVEALVTAGKASWKVYDPDNKSTLVQDKKNYVYAAVHDKAGNVTYVSTNYICYDTIAPKLSKATVAGTGSATAFKAEFEGTDELSGVDHFRILHAEKTETTDVPTKSDMVKNGTKVAISSTTSDVSKGSTNVTGLDENKNYVFYMAAVDKAGNVSDIVSSVKGKLTGKITIDDYMSTTFATKDAIALYVKESKKFIVAPDDTALEASKIEYFISDTFYSSPADVEKKATWVEYSSQYSTTLEKNKKNYIYVKLSDDNGNVGYLSTGAVIYDAVPPEMSILSGVADDNNQYILTLQATDALSGMNQFAVLCKEDSDEMTDPTAEEILKSGFKYKAEAEPGKSVKIKAAVPDIDPNKNYVAYVIAVDKAGLPTEVQTYDIYGENTGSIGTITVDKYTSKKFQTKDTAALYSNTTKKVVIRANELGPGFASIEYFVSDSFVGNPAEVEKLVKEKSSSWTAYSSDYPPTLTKDKKNYVYARFTSKNGRYYYLSTGAIYYDTVAPKMQVNTATKGSAEGEYKVVFGGTDDLSGINRFKLMIQEKTSDKMDPPSKDYIFNMGTYIEVTKEEKLVSGATYTAKGIETGKSYMFWFAAVDRAGNISDVTSQEIKGEAGGSGGSGSGGSGSGSSGLTPAPNGIAGSGTPKKDQSGAGSGKASDTKKSALGDKDREINRNPYIADASGTTIKIGQKETSGWDKIVKEISKADNGGVVEVEMSGTSQVPAKLFSAMQGKDVDVRLRMAEGVLWSIKGTAISSANVGDKEMGVKLGSRNIPDKVVADVAGTYAHVEFSLLSEEPLGFTAGILIPVDRMNKGMNATLYKYDSKKKELVVAGTSVVDENGYVQFDITEGADYTVAVSPEKIMESSQTVGVDDTDKYAPKPLGGSSIQLSDIFSKRGGSAMWLFFLALISALLCVAILFAPTFQEKKEDEFKNIM